MRAILAIADADFRNALRTPLGYAALAAFVFVYGVLYAGAVMTPGRMPTADIGALVMTLPVVMVLLAPLLTMRCLAGERANGSDMLLRSLPVSPWRIAWGKFLGVAALFLCMICLSLVFPAFVRHLGGSVDAKAFFAHVAFFALGLAYLAIGVAFSACADGMAGSAILSFAALFFIQGLAKSFAVGAGGVLAKTAWLLGADRLHASASDQVGRAATEILLWLNPAGKLALFSKGIFRLTPLVYFATVVVLALGLAALFLRRRRWKSRRDVAAYLASAACLLGVNAAVDARWGDRIAWDVTAEKVFSLGPESRRLLEGLNDRVLIWAFFDIDDPTVPDNDSALFLRRYELHGGGRIDVVFEDPARDRGSLARNGLPGDADLSGAAFAVINRTNGRYRLIGADEILTERRDLGGERMQLLGIEQAVSGAVSHVAAPRVRRALVLKGHGEERKRPLFARALAMVEAAGYDCEIFDPILAGGIPDDADLALMLEPVMDMDAGLAEGIVRYVAGGGRMLLAAGFSPAGFPRLNEALGRFGVAVTDNRLRETHRELFFADDPFSFVAVSPNSDAFPGVQSVLAVMARETRADNPPPAGVVLANLLHTSNGSVAEPGGAAEREEAAGTRSLGVAVEKMGKKTGRLIVLGTADAFVDPVLDRAGAHSEANRKFWAGVVAWLCDGEAAGLGIYAKGIPNYTLAITSGKLPFLYFSVYFGLLAYPPALLGIGLGVYWMRKRV